MSRRRALLAAAALTLLVPACSADGSDAGSDGPTPTTEGGDTPTTEGGETPTTETEPEPDPDADADDVLIDAVDTTLGTDSFQVDSTAELQVAAQEFGLRSSGQVDYENLVADVELAVEGEGQDADIALRADGTNLWIRAGGNTGVELPDGKTWVEGEASRLTDSDNFEPSDLIGVILALRASDGAEAGDTEEIDGVEATSYTVTIDYDEAVEAAGDDAEAFQSALSLTSPDPVALEIEAWVGDDGVIRRFSLEVDAGAAALGGSYEVELSEIGAEVDAPEPPDAAETVTGPEAESILDELVG